MLCERERVHEGEEQTDLDVAERDEADKGGGEHQEQEQNFYLHELHSN
jgi:hypothetical protein